MAAGKEYTIVDGVIFNGARDTAGGIWVRLNDDDDHRILSAAVTKQIKNTEAAKGTLSALDPNAPHLLDDILASLNRVLASVNGARPASAQLRGTPIGEAMAEGAGKKGGGRKRGGKKGADADVAGSIGTEDIQWADGVPQPRPRVGTAFWTALGFANEVPQYAQGVLGYDAENGHFVVYADDAASGKTPIVWNADWQEWIGVGAQPASPSNTLPDQAATAVKELIAALRAGPADLEDSQFESVATVARTLLLVVATPNERADEIRTVAEFVDEYRTLAENAVELAGGIEYDLSQAVLLTLGDANAGSGDASPERNEDTRNEDERRAESVEPKDKPRRTAAKKSAAAKGGTSKGSGLTSKGGKKRKR